MFKTVLAAALITVASPAFAGNISISAARPTIAIHIAVPPTVTAKHVANIKWTPGKAASPTR